jgi:hypothetical protein
MEPEERVMDPMPEELARLDDELSGVRSWPRLDPGVAAVAVAVGVLVLLGAVALPWVGPTTGWALLVGTGPVVPGAGVLPRLFATTAVVFGVAGSSSALLTRLWALGWVSALGCGFSVVNGLWAVWSRQTAAGSAIDPAPGPGIGLVLALLAMIALTVMWVRIAWTRPGGRAAG